MHTVMSAKKVVKAAADNTHNTVLLSPAALYKENTDTTSLVMLASSFTANMSLSAHTTCVASLCTHRE
jgi:hypothetical protein